MGLFTVFGKLFWDLFHYETKSYSLETKVTYVLKFGHQTLIKTTPHQRLLNYHHSSQKDYPSDLPAKPEPQKYDRVMYEQRTGLQTGINRVLPAKRPPGSFKSPGRRGLTLTLTFDL